MRDLMPGERSVTPVIGNILLVAVVVVIAVVLVVLSFTFLEGAGTPTAEASFEYEQTSVGLELRPQALGTDVVVKLNGRDVTTIEADSAGEPVLLPTAPGDRVTIVSRDGDRSVLVEKTIDERSEVGDFIAYYDFEGSGKTLVDQSGNNNNGTIQGDPDRTASGLRFDGENDYVEVTSLDAEVDVDKFTIAVAYTPTNETEKQELVEHKSGQDNWLLELKPCSWSVANCTGSGYAPIFSVDDAGGSQTGQIVGDKLRKGDRHVAVGTYDGTDYTLYIDGNKQDTGEYGDAISMGDLNIAQDIESSNDDNFHGEITEVRLYYSSFDEQEVDIVTNAMF